MKRQYFVKVVGMPDSFEVEKKSTADPGSKDVVKKQCGCNEKIVMSCE